jgi:hypothetical protein
MASMEKTEYSGFFHPASRLIARHLGSQNGDGVVARRIGIGLL